MKITLSTYQIAEALIQDENAAWSRSGAFALAEYLEELETDCGTEEELDVVAIRCECSEFGSLYQWADEYFSGDAWMSECGLDVNVDYEESEHGDNIRDYIQDYGHLIEFDGGIIVSSF